MLSRALHARKQGIVLSQALSNSWEMRDEPMYLLRNPYVCNHYCPLNRQRFNTECSKWNMQCIFGSPDFDSKRKGRMIRPFELKCMSVGSLEVSIDEDDELCPVECVREFKTDEELFSVLDKAKENKALVVIDFYRTSCGSCKYIEQGFAKLCKGSGAEEAAVIFLKHNVINEYDEQSEVAERLRIKNVPLFHFYKDGVLVEAFPTREKERIKAAILKYTASAQNV